MPHLLYPFICWWTLRLAVVNKPAVNIGVRVIFLN